jgi:putative inorganic carbon (HCO3(-)) transporter
VVFSINRLNSFKEIYKYITGLLLFLAASSLTYKDKMRVINTIVYAGFIISLLAVYQYFFGFRHLLNYATKTNITDSFTLDYIASRRVYFPFVTPNTLAGYLAMLIPLALLHKKKIYFIITLSFALLLTKSLGALLSLFLALLIYFFLQGKFEKRKVVLFLTLIVIISSTFIIRSTGQKPHLKPAFSTVMRLNYWKDALKIIKTAPFAGVGLGNFNLPQSRYAHNSYLQIWAETGILGIVSFLWLIVIVFAFLLQKIKSITDRKHAAGLITAAVVFLIHNFFDFTFFLPEIANLWWLVLGIIMP